MVKYSKQREQQISSIFRALADPTRRKILKMLSQRDRKASELAQSFRISFPAVSKHLKVLEKARLIQRDVDGRIHRFYFREGTMKKAYQWIKFYESFWLQKLDHLDRFLKQENKKEG